MPADPLTAPWRPDTGFVPVPPDSRGPADRPGAAPPGPDRVPTAYDPGPPRPGHGEPPYRRPDGGPPGRPAPSNGPAYRPDAFPPSPAPTAGPPASGLAGYRSEGDPSGHGGVGPGQGAAAYRSEGDPSGQGRVGPAGTAYPLGPPPDPTVGGRRSRRERTAEPVDEVPSRTHRAAPPDLPDRPQRPGGRSGRGVVAVLTSLVLALALVAAGVWWFALRETGVDAPTYARSVCGSVRDWQQGVDASSSALVKSIPRQQDRAAIRSELEKYYADLATRTDGLRAAVVDAGTVDVPGGRAYADSLAAAVGDQSASLRDLAARAGRLDVDAVAVFLSSLPDLLTGAETAVSAVTAALARPAAGTPAQLRLALSDEPACAPYVG